MHNIQTTIVGTAPLILHRFTDEAAREAGGQKRSGIKKDVNGEDVRALAAPSLYIGRESGKPVIPAPNLWKCLIEGGRWFKVGRKGVTTRDSSLLAGVVRIEELEIPIENDNDPMWEVDVRPVTNQVTKGKMLAYRPIFYEWRMKFTIELDPDGDIGIPLFRSVVDKAGRQIGLGVMRPERKGAFGTWRVDHWEVE